MKIEERVLLACVRLHVLRASKHVFLDRSLLRALLLRLCSIVKIPTALGSAVDVSPNQASVGAEDIEIGGVVTSTPQKADIDPQTSVNESLKQVLMLIFSL